MSLRPHRTCLIYYGTRIFRILHPNWSLLKAQFPGEQIFSAKHLIFQVKILRTFLLGYLPDNQINFYQILTTCTNNLGSAGHKFMICTQDIRAELYNVYVILKKCGLCIEMGTTDLHFSQSIS